MNVIFGLLNFIIAVAWPVTAAFAVYVAWAFLKTKRLSDEDRARMMAVELRQGSQEARLVAFATLSDTASLDVRLKAVEGKLQSEGRLDAVAGSFGGKKR